jgi:hypothetical protein
MVRTMVGRVVAFAVAVLALPAVARAAETAVQAAAACCGSGCPLGCC